MSYKIGDKVKVKDIPGDVEILSFFNCKGTNYIVFETDTGMKSRPESDIIEDEPEIDPLGVYLTVSIEDGVAIAKMFDREGGELLYISHGHVLTDTLAGVAQAAGYAFKRIQWQIEKQNEKEAADSGDVLQSNSSRRWATERKNIIYSTGDSKGRR